MKNVWSILTLAAVLMTGCVQIQKATRIEPAKLSGFLPKPELMTLQEATFPFHYFYLKKDAGTYDNVYIAPVNTSHLRKNVNWAKFDQAMAAKLGTDIRKLADFTREAYVREFNKMKGPHVLNVVEDPKMARTLFVEVAIVSLIPTKAEVNILGTAANFLLPGIGVLAGQAAAGSVTIECLIRDGRTGEIIAMYANTERDERAILNFAGMTWYTSAQNNIQIQALHTASVFSGKDYSYTRRQLIHLIKL